MEFLLFQPPFLGDGMVIGVNAVIHVILSHGVAIGLVTMIALSEYVGIRRNMAEGESFARQLLTPTVLIITGAGSVTGVGIWFTTSVMAPTGIGGMLRVFFWPWFIEWIVFVFEAGTLLFLYYKWDTWGGDKKHYRVRFGFAYTGLGFLSAVLITGIMAFMLTADGWPWDKSFRSAFFNPGFLPQLVLRLGISFSLGALFALAALLFSKRDDRFRDYMLNIYGRVFLVSIVITALSSWWYFAAVPSTFKTHAVFSMLTSRLSQNTEVFWMVNTGGAVLLLLFAAFALLRSAGVSRFLILPAILVAFGFVSEYERIREFIRGPYVMPGYMYSNQILLKESVFLGEAGLLQNAYWFNTVLPQPADEEKGAFLFAQNCKSCHTIGGINDIKDRVRGRTEDGIAVILNHTNDMVPFMPPFSGSDEERLLLARFLYQLAEGKVRLAQTYRYTPLKGSGRE